MQAQHHVPAATILSNWSDDPWTNGVQVDRMEDMEKLVVRTWNSICQRQRRTEPFWPVLDGASDPPEPRW